MIGNLGHIDVHDLKYMGMSLTTIPTFLPSPTGARGKSPYGQARVAHTSHS